MRNLVLSTHRLNMLQSCPRLYFFSHVLNKTPVDKPKYFTEGEYLHYILEQYYIQKMTGNTPNIDNVILLARNKATEIVGLTIQECEGLIDIFKEYIQFHSGETWKIEGVEVPFAKVLWEDEKLDIRIIIQGKADLLALSNQSIPLIIDHKKVSQNRQPYSRDNQILSYCWAFNRQDFIINQLGTQKSLKPQDKFKRHYFNVLGYQIDEWVEETIYCALEAIKFFENQYWPGRIKNCQNQGRTCTFYEVCSAEKSNWDYKLQAFKTSEDYDLMENE
jgi:hypothetical protein